MILRCAQVKGAQSACHAERSEMVRGASHLMKSKHPLPINSGEITYGSSDRECLAWERQSQKECLSRLIAMEAD
jgi:hypothetical protein